MSNDDIPLVVEREDWTKRAACHGVDPNVFFPTRGEDVEAARAICDGCPVKAECLDYALRTSQKFGIWGGSSERDRRPSPGSRLRHRIRLSTAPAVR